MSLLLLPKIKATFVSSWLVNYLVLSEINYRIFSIKRRVYLKLGLANSAFIRTRRLFIKCSFQYWKLIEPRTKIQQKRLKNVKRWHQLCLI